MVCVGFAILVADGFSSRHDSIVIDMIFGDSANQRLEDVSEQ